MTKLLRDRSVQVDCYLAPHPGNDADNGVFLPRSSRTSVPSLPGALSHGSIHTNRYYLAITFRLLAIGGSEQLPGRVALRAIRAELIAGTFQA